MNGTQSDIHEDPLPYQTERLKDLLEQIIECCRTRTDYLSSKFHIPQAELRCLLLFKGERYLTVKGIAQKLDVAKSRVTKIVDGLVRKKLVNRINDPEDARIKLISHTKAGARVSKQIEMLNEELHRQLLQELEPEARKTVLSSLDRLRSGMEVVKQMME